MWFQLASGRQWQIHIFFPVGFLDVVLPKLTSPPYMMNMREQPVGSPVLAHFFFTHRAVVKARKAFFSER